MKELIERLEKATGPDRGLDADIMRLTFGAEVWSYDDNDHIDHMIERGMWTKPREEHPDFDPHPQVTWRYRCGGLANPEAEYGEIQPYTSSIDAALTLVPEDCEIEAFRFLNADKSTEWLFKVDVEFNTVRGEGASPAIALCVAALKARAAISPPAIPAESSEAD